MKNRAYAGRTKTLKYDVGYIDKSYRVVDTTTGWFCPYYRRWASMLQRAYSEHKKKTRPTYEDVTVCKEWHNFHTFKEWMQEQEWDGMDLDKDILSVITGKTEYSPDNCAFVPRELNSFFTLRQNHRGDYPLGVTVNISRYGKVMYVARLNKPTGRVSLGRYNTPEEAHRAWQLAKYKYGVELLDRQTDPRIIAAMHVILHRLGEDWANNRITEKLI